jgi:DNA invertase Pin-like site-specific DNA recombinase
MGGEQLVGIYVSGAEASDSLKQFARDRDWVVRIYTDRGALMRDCQQKTIGAVLIWSLDSLGRDLQELMHTLETLRQSEVGLYSLTEGINSFSEKLFFAHVAIFANFDSHTSRTTQPPFSEQSPGPVEGQPKGVAQ